MWIGLFIAATLTCLGFMLNPIMGILSMQLATTLFVDYNFKKWSKRYEENGNEKKVKFIKYSNIIIVTIMFILMIPTVIECASFFKTL